MGRVAHGDDRRGCTQASIGCGRDGDERNGSASVRRNVTVERYDGLALALFACSIDHFS